MQRIVVNAGDGNPSFLGANFSANAIMDQTLVPTEFGPALEIFATSGPHAGEKMFIASRVDRALLEQLATGVASVILLSVSGNGDLSPQGMTFVTKEVSGV
jgi:hypothetical protein